MIIDAIYFFIPAYVANTFACLLGRGRPVDMGAKFVDGRRVLGDGVTVRGSLAGVLLGTLSGLFMVPFKHPFLPDASSYKIMFLAFILSCGAILGDAAGSFIKRRIGLERGAPAPLLDQLNFVIGSLLLAGFMVKVPFRAMVVLFLITPFAHLLANKTGYILKLKDVPW